MIFLFKLYNWTTESQHYKHALYFVVISRTDKKLCAQEQVEIFRSSYPWGQSGILNTRLFHCTEDATLLCPYQEPADVLSSPNPPSSWKQPDSAWNSHADSAVQPWGTTNWLCMLFIAQVRCHTQDNGRGNGYDTVLWLPIKILQWMQTQWLWNHGKERPNV